MSYYGTLTDAAVYHDARGNSAWATYTPEQQQAALVRGSDYVDQRYREKLKSGKWVSMFSGVRAGGRAQDREWPRTGATDYEGNEVASDVVPVEVEHAAYEGALREAAAPNSLSPDYVPSSNVKRRKVGPIEREFFAPKEGEIPNRPIIPAIDEMIAPLLLARYDFPAVTVV